MLMTLLNKFGDCSEHSWFDTVPTAPPPPAPHPAGRTQGGRCPSLLQAPRVGLALTSPCSSEELKATRRAEGIC